VKFSLPMTVVCALGSVVGVMTMAVGVVTMVVRAVPPAAIPKIYGRGRRVIYLRSADRRGGVNDRGSLTHRCRGTINRGAVDRGRCLIYDPRSHNRRDR